METHSCRKKQLIVSPSALPCSETHNNAVNFLINQQATETESAVNAAWKATDATHSEAIRCRWRCCVLCTLGLMQLKYTRKKLSHYTVRSTIDYQ